MRTFFTLSILFASTLLYAQVVNGDFEDQLTGWTATCPSATQISNNVPPGGGLYSVVMPMLTPTEDCYVFDGVEPLLHQELPGVVNGDVLSISYWQRGIPIDPNEAQLLTSFHFLGWFDDMDIYNVLPNQGGGYFAGAWAQRILTYTVTGLPTGATLSFMLGGHAFQNSLGGTVGFDNVQLVIDTPTSLNMATPAQPHFGPSPATDKLWINVTRAPVGLRLFDAQGRSVRTPPMHQGEEKLELDVEALSSGLYVLCMDTGEGLSTIRFLKQ